MSRQSNQSNQSPGWTISAQSVSMAASLVAIVLAAVKPISYVSDLRVAVERLAEATARMDSAAQRQDERLRAIEARELRLAALAETPAERRRCPGAASTR